MYEVRLARRAERGLRKVRAGDPSGYRRVAEAIRSLATEPRPPGAARLQGLDPPALRIRVGSYRIIYEVRDRELVVLVVNVASRGEVYR